MSRRYPYISLSKAVERTRQLFEKENLAQTPVPVAVSHWDYGPKSSGGRMTLAALISYGLLDDEGSGDTRKVSVSTRGRRILLDKRDSSPERDAELREAALGPKLFRELWDEWSTNWPSESTMEHHLKFSLDFDEKPAKDCIRTFLDTVAYSGLRNSDSIEDLGEDENDNLPELDVGQYIQWEIDGSLQLPKARQISGFSKDGQFVFVHGSDTGIPIAEAIESDPPKNRQESIQRSGRSMQTPTEQESGSGARVLSIPLPGERVAILETPIGLSSGDHDFLVKYLTLMKGALIGDAASVVDEVDPDESV